MHAESVASCPACRAPLQGPRHAGARVCDACGHHLPLGAPQRVLLLVDPGSFRETEGHLVSVDPLGFHDIVAYRLRLLKARRQTGLPEAVVTGIGKIHGNPCVLAVSDFGFMGGSMGSVVGEKVTRAMELAIKTNLPFVAITASGGARLQEGMLSLVQMAKTGAAAGRLHDAGVPFISVLADPTTGGVLASYASQGDVLLAEPGARLGFAGPRVVREVTGQELSGGLQTAESFLDHGLLDGIVARDQLRDRLGELLGLLGAGPPPSAPLPHPLPPSPGPAQGAPRTPLVRGTSATHRPPSPTTTSPRSPSPATLERGPGGEARTAWAMVQLARRADRPTAVDYLRRIAKRFVELRGDRVSGDDPALVSGIGEVGGETAMILAQERGHGTEATRRHHGRMGPSGYRKARRLIQLAGRLGLPILTFVDTPGAELSIEAETGGLAEAISECLAELMAAPVPVVATIIGEGGSGGALALGVGDRVLMQQNAIYSVIGPEGAAAILYRSKEPAPDVAEALKLTAADCLRLGVVDQVVPEPPGGAQRDPVQAVRLLQEALVAALAQQSQAPGPRLAEARYRKYRRLGCYESRFRQSIEERFERTRAGLAGLIVRGRRIFGRGAAPVEPGVVVESPPSSRDVVSRRRA